MMPLTLAELEERLLTFFKDKLSTQEISYIQPPVLYKEGRNIRTYRFRLTGVPKEYSRTFVLRLYTEKESTVRPQFEAILQNSLIEEGIAAPRVHFSEGSIEYLNAPFLIMDECPGEVLFDINTINEKPYMQAARFLVSGVGSIARQLADVAVKLHNAGVDKLKENLQSIDFPVDHLSLNGRLYQLYKRIQNAKLDGLEEGIVWLIAHGPPEPERPVLCHGQLYPNNVIMQGDQVRCIINWSVDSILIGDPAYDIGKTSAAFKCFVPQVTQSLRRLSYKVGKRFAKQFPASYLQKQSLNKNHIEYFEMMWCIDLATSAAESVIGQSHVYKKEFEEERIDLYKSAVNAVELFKNTTDVSITLPLLRR